MWQLVNGEIEVGGLDREGRVRGLDVSLGAGFEKVAATDC